ncbi:MAG: (E)-2-((N-methylformamido)methylene)succinate hydrolase [Thermoleophilaceae bacterium]|jgi:3-oxoadipate enol-lactonase|nr:(E)-2-((N-methylformamido)methylene)succinate hydrolase [Thermoleophilaceae bacterium]
MAGLINDSGASEPTVVACAYQVTDSRHSVTSDAPPVLLIHGVGLDRTMWRHQVGPLSRRAPVFTYDLRGHGESPALELVESLGDYLADLVWLLDERFRAERVDVVGFSLGGLIAQAFAVEHPERVNRLVLSNTFARDPADRELIMERLSAVRTASEDGAVEASLSRWFTADFLSSDGDSLDWIGARLKSNDRRAYLASHRITATADHTLADRLHQITAPTLVLTAEDDLGATPTMAHRLADSIAGAECRILEGCRHLCMIERPDDYLRVLTDFLYPAQPAAALAPAVPDRE